MLLYIYVLLLPATLISILLLFRIIKLEYYVLTFDNHTKIILRLRTHLLLVLNRTCIYIQIQIRNAIVYVYDYIVYTLVLVSTLHKYPLLSYTYLYRSPPGYYLLMLCILLWFETSKRECLSIYYLCISCCMPPHDTDLMEVK
jgi:hypothetical protein